MSSLTEQAKRVFDLYVHENVVKAFERECSDIILNMSRNTFDDEKQKRRFMKFIENNKYGDVVAALYACRLSRPGEMFFEWGRARLCSRLCDLYVEGDEHAEFIADYALNYIQTHIRNVPHLYAEVWHEVKKNESMVSQARRLYNHCYKKARKSIGLDKS